MKSEKISTEIAALERKVKSAKNALVKKVLEKKIDSLRQELKKEEDGVIKLAKAKKKIREMSESDFNKFIKNLSKKEGFSFLKSMTKDEIKRDIQRTAKPVGWRFRGDNTKKPTRKDIREDNNVYYEGRRNRSDVSRAVKLKTGGEVSDIKKGQIYDWFEKGIENTISVTDVSNGEVSYRLNGRSNVKSMSDFEKMISEKGLKAGYKMETGGTAESSETGEFIGGENASSMYKTGGTVSPYIVWVSKDGDKREFYGEYKSQRAAKMAMDKLWNTGEYDSMGYKLKSNYEKNGFYKDGGEVEDEAEYDSVYEIHIKEGKDGVPFYAIWDKIDGVELGHFAFKTDAENWIKSKMYADGGGVGESYVIYTKDFVSGKLKVSKIGEYKSYRLAKKALNEIQNPKSKDYPHGKVNENGLVYLLTTKENFEEMYSNKYSDGGEIEEEKKYVWEHRHTKGITAEILDRTSKGFKVKQTEEYEAWGDKKLSKPKVKTAFYSEKEFLDLFKIKGLKYEQGGGLSMTESFPNNDGMSYAKGGSLFEEPHRSEMKGMMKLGGSTNEFKYEIFSENTKTGEKSTVALVKAYGDIPLMITGLKMGVVSSPIKYGFKQIK